MATDQEIALGPLVAGSDDDAEQTGSARLPSWSKGKAALGVGVALLLLGSAACFSQGGAARGDAMGSMIQSRAVAEHGRVLTKDELVKVLPTHLRKLADSPLISEECQKAIAEYATESFQKLVTLSLDVVAQCHNSTGKAAQPPSAQEALCKAAQDKVATFQKDLNAECKESGEYCTIVQQTTKKYKSVDLCVPTECHGLMDVAEEWSDNLQTVKYPNCSQCSVEINCGIAPASATPVTPTTN